MSNNLPGDPDAAGQWTLSEEQGPSRAWWRMLVIPVLGRLRQEDQVHGQSQLLSEALYNLARSCFKIKNKKIGQGV